MLFGMMRRPRSFPSSIANRTTIPSLEATRERQDGCGLWDRQCDGVTGRPGFGIVH